MKICLISKECFPFYYGGIGSTFYALGRVLSDLGHEVVLLSKQPLNSSQYTITDHYKGSFRLEWIQYTEGQFFIHNRLDYAYQLELYFEKFNADFHADLVLMPEFDAEGYFLMKGKNEEGKYQGSTFITHFSGPLFSLYESVNKSSSFYEKIIFKMEEYCIRASRYSIAPSAFIWQHLNKRFKLKHQTNFIYPNLINASVFTEPLQTNQPAEEQKNILFIGRLQEIKGADILLKSFINLLASRNDLNIKLQFIGADLHWDEYGKSFVSWWKEQLPANVLSKIEFTGALPQEKIFEYLRKAYVAVFPSRFETFGNVALEAMYANVPVIVNSEVGLGEVIGSEYDISWKISKGATGLSETIEKVLTDDQLYKKLKEKTFNRAKELHENRKKLVGFILDKLAEAEPAENSTEDLEIVKDEIFILAGQFSANVMSEKNEEIRKAYDLKDNELKKAWTEYDKKNQELADLFQKHESEIKNAWTKYDEKDKELAETWKKHDEKENALNRIAADHNQLKEELRALEKTLELQMAGDKVDLTLNGQWKETGYIYEQVHKMAVEHASLNKRLELIWGDLKKEQFEAGLLKSKIESLEKIIPKKEEQIQTLEKKINDLTPLLERMSLELENIKSSDAYVTSLKLKQRRFLLSLVKKLT